MSEVEEVKVAKGTTKVIVKREAVYILWKTPKSGQLPTFQFTGSNTDEVRRMLKDALAALDLADKVLEVQPPEFPGEHVAQ